ncbi:hypothetical protein EJ08DRAFT_698646 [Tothia fuscella]|uniref:BTB domain-containing protein n=1 Tax=Tothia fuscella TaxID=1048955 RepID=A0A9P4TXB8_9PEZI|nr:hypothetical protein EJ08DRAFT_698646 [Tothia fuscella]
MVKFLVGEDETEILFFRDLVKAVSLKFKTAFEGDFSTEAEAKEIKLPNELPRTIIPFQQWLHTGYISLPDHTTLNPTMWAIQEGQHHDLGQEEGSAMRCQGCNGLQLVDAEELVVWRDDLLVLLRFADEHDIPTLTTDVMIAWQSLDELPGAVTPYELICAAFFALPTGHVFLEYLIEMYRYYVEDGWDNCGCSCGFVAADESPHPCTADDLPIEFRDRMLTSDAVNSTVNGGEEEERGMGEQEGEEEEEITPEKYFDWCCFHAHEGFDYLVCQTSRFNQGRFGVREQFYQEWLAVVTYDEHAAAYSSNPPGQWY